MSTDVVTPGSAHRETIAGRIKAQRGLRAQESFAARLGASSQRISKYERGFIPDSWFFLARLHDEEGVDLNALLTAKDNGR